MPLSKYAVYDSKKKAIYQRTTSKLIYEQMMD